MDCTFLVFRALHNAPPQNVSDEVVEVTPSSDYKFYEVPDEELKY